MLIFDGLQGIFRKFKIRNKNENCAICSEKATIDPTKFDYEKFCGTVSCDVTQQPKLLHEFERIDVFEYKNILDTKQPHVLIDVRPQNDFNIVNLSHAKNIPLQKLKTKEGLEEFLKYINESKSEQNIKSNEELNIYCLCKIGFSSQVAVQFLKSNISDLYNLNIKDIEGGITAYSKKIDPSLPFY